MKISLEDYFSVYVLVFLAGVMGAWLIGLWNRHRQARRSRETFPCRVCHQPVPVGDCLVHTRCPACGARNRIPTDL